MGEWSEEKPNTLTPVRVTEYHAVLAGYAAALEDEFADLEIMKPIYMSSLESGMSEAERLRRWETTEEGQRHKKLKSKLKAIDRIIAACKRLMDRFTMQGFNKY